MQDIIKIVLNWAIPLILTGMLGFMIKVVSDNRTMKSSMLSLIRSQIVSKCERYLKQGYLPEYARYCLQELFSSYQKLGGNHGIEELVNQTFKLPPSEIIKEGNI